jgi:hypothetical protein
LRREETSDVVRLVAEVVLLHPSSVYPQVDRSNVSGNVVCTAGNAEVRFGAFGLMTIGGEAPSRIQDRP